MRSWSLTKGIIIISIITGSSCLSQTNIDQLATQISLTAEVVSNIASNDPGHDVKITLGNTGSSPIPATGWKIFFHNMFLLFPDVFPKNKSISLYPESVKVSMINGDLYSLEPVQGFKEITKGSVQGIVLKSAFWSVSRTDFMPNWYILSSDGSGEPRILTSTLTLDYVKPFTSEGQLKRYKNDMYHPFTPEDRMERLKVNDTKKAVKMVIPTPKSLKIDNQTSTTVDVDRTWKIYSSSNETTAAAMLLSGATNISATGMAPAGNRKTIVLSITSKPNPEGYSIKIKSTQTIELSGNGGSGLFYAVQSLLSILNHYNNMAIPTLTIEDEPRFGYRGMHIDVSRNFHTVDDLKMLIKAMAMYKMNKLHLHLSDDEGWRLEIPGLPELTQIASKRCHDLDETMCVIPQFGSGPFANTSGTGFFTISEYRDILQFAKDHHIEIIPEFDMPGHAHAAITAMENRFNKYAKTGNMSAANQYRLVDPNDTSTYISVQQWTDNAINPCIESTYNFISKVMDELRILHAYIMPLKNYHFGGDEVASGAWSKSPACTKIKLSNREYQKVKGLKKYFVERVSDLTAKKGLQMSGWEDGFMGDNGQPFPIDAAMNNSNMAAYAWDNIWEWGASQRAYRLANAGYKVVMAQATDLYFDQPQEPDPEERGLYWASRFTDTMKTFTFMPDSLYDNIDAKRSGEKLTKVDVCGADMSKCDPLNKPENILGMQGELWSETVRSSENMQYMIFPRLLALAERAWHKSTFEAPGLDPVTRDDVMNQDWSDFANTLGYRELSRLDKMGIKYRVPPPGARIHKGQVEVSTTFPGLPIQYKIDNQARWTDVQGTISLQNGDKKVFLRTLSADRNRSSREVQLTQDETSIDNKGSNTGKHESTRKPLPTMPQEDLDYIASHVTTRIEVVDNLLKLGNFVTLRLNLTNTNIKTVKPGPWKLNLFSLYGFKTEELPCGMRVGHVNGDLYFVTPSKISPFKEIKRGATLSCILYNKWWSVSRTDQMPNWFVTAEGLQPRIMTNTADESLSFVGKFDTPAKWKRTVDDIYNPINSTDRYDMHETHGYVESIWRTVPTTKSRTVTNDENVIHLRAYQGWKVLKSKDFDFEANFLADHFKLQLVSSYTYGKIIGFAYRKQTDKEAYDLDISHNNITIYTEAGPGALHGVQTIISLAASKADGTIPNMKISDKPRFSYRGLMLDVARNFKPVPWIKKLLDVMSMYKLNKLHLHLTDNEGWRVEIPEIPELTQVGGKRCHTEDPYDCVIPARGSGPYSNNTGSGFYTVEDYRSILKYAADRHIDIIPEVDTPGHFSAAITAMFRRETIIAERRAAGIKNLPESYDLTDVEMTDTVETIHKFRANAINPCMESPYAFMEKVANGLKSLHSGIMPLSIFHIGGDEVAEGAWDQSKHCNNKSATEGYKSTQALKQIFVKRVAAMLSTKNLSMAAWEDGIYGEGRPNPITDYKNTKVYVFSWNNRWGSDTAGRATEFADAGYKVILNHATHLYLDHPYESDPEERGLYWAARYIGTRKVFSYMPDNITNNADVDRMGQPVDVTKLCHNKPCSSPKYPENLIGLVSIDGDKAIGQNEYGIFGMQASMFSDVIRNEEQTHYMLFPRLLAFAERAWNKASWEDIENKESRDSEMEADLERFKYVLGRRELQRLEKMGIKYRIPPPGGRFIDGKLRVNTMYSNLRVEYSTDTGKTWQMFKKPEKELKLDDTVTSILIRSTTQMNRHSRSIEVKLQKTATSGQPSSLASLATIYLYTVFTVVMFYISRD